MSKKKKSKSFLKLFGENMAAFDAGKKKAQEAEKKKDAEMAAVRKEEEKLQKEFEKKIEKLSPEMQANIAASLKRTRAR